MKEKIKFLENEIGNNAEYERRIAASERKVLKCRMEYQRHEASRSQLKDEVRHPNTVLHSQRIAQSMAKVYLIREWPAGFFFP